MNAREQAIFGRTELLLGEDVMQALSRMKVIIFGVGGVGSWCAEGLVRSGIKHLTIVDSDRVSITNVNRQLMATVKTVGQVKVEALKTRLLEINPDAEIEAVQAIYCDETADSFDLDSYDYVVDAVEGCPLGSALRKKMKRAKTLPASKFLCVYDDEVLLNRGGSYSLGLQAFVEGQEGIAAGDPALADHEWDSSKAQINGTTAYITAIFGMTLSGLVIDDVYHSVIRKMKQ